MGLTQRIWLLLAALVGVAILAGLRPAPRAELRGQVLSLQGAPVSATVHLVGLDLSTHTDARGGFALPFPPGRFTLRYEAPGYITRDQEWLFTMPREVQLSPVTLVMPPPREGLWRLSGNSYRALPSSPVSWEEAAALGLNTFRTPELHVKAAPERVCLGRPLVLKAPAGSTEPVVEWSITPEGRLLPGGSALGSARMQITALDRGIWQVVPARPGPVALLPEGEPEARPLAWFLEVVGCGEAS